jgi:hypothetical protein
LTTYLRYERSVTGGDWSEVSGEPQVVSVAMGVFSLASLGEISLHPDKLALCPRVSALHASSATFCGLSTYWAWNKVCLEWYYHLHASSHFRGLALWRGL